MEYVFTCCVTGVSMIVSTVLYRVEVDVIEVSGEIPIIADRVLPVPPLPDAAFTAAAHRGRSRFGGGQGFPNAILIARQRSAKSGSPSGRVQRQCMWSGRTTHASMRNGARARACRTASRRTPIRVTNRSERRSSRLTVKKKYAASRRKAEGAALFRPTSPTASRPPPLRVKAARHGGVTRWR
jgi:hypothetical protein